jgi:hypothetical protein
MSSLAGSQHRGFAALANRWHPRRLEPPQPPPPRLDGSITARGSAGRPEPGPTGQRAPGMLADVALPIASFGGLQGLLEQIGEIGTCFALVRFAIRWNMTPRTQSHRTFPASRNVHHAGPRNGLGCWLRPVVVSGCVHEGLLFWPLKRRRGACFLADPRCYTC